jgi:sugar lactone lactonase YvrE
MAGASLISARCQSVLAPVEIGQSTTTTITIYLESGGTIGRIAVLTQGSPDLDFRDAGGGTCTVGAAYQAKATCTVNVEFKPRYSGARYGAIVIYGSQPDQHPMAAIYLQGSGVGPQAIFQPGQEIDLGDNYFYVVGVASDSSANLFVADAGNLLWMGTIPGSVYKETFSDGHLLRTKIGSHFRVPWGVAVDGMGNVYVSDAWNYRVYKETLQPDGTYLQTTVSSTLQTPLGVAVDGAGNVYTADFGSGSGIGAVYKETPSEGGYIQTAIGSNWRRPYGIAVDNEGNLYVADFGSYFKHGGVLKEEVRGSKYIQSKVGNKWFNPTAITVDGTGNLYVADIGQFAVFRESLQDGAYVQSVIKEYTSAFGAYWPYGVAVDGDRSVYVADAFKDAVTQWVFAAAPSFRFANTVIDTKSEDSPRSATILNVGTSPLSISDLRYPRDFPESVAGTSDCADGVLVAAGQDCELTIDFAPRAPLGKSDKMQLDESVSLFGNSLGREPFDVKIDVQGTEVKSFPRTAEPVISPDGGTFTGPRHVRITDTTPGSTIYFTIDGSTPTTKSLKFYSWETIILSTNTTVKAIAVAPEHSPSAVIVARFDFE